MSLNMLNVCKGVGFEGEQCPLVVRFAIEASIVRNRQQSPAAPRRRQTLGSVQRAAANIRLRRRVRWWRGS
jgi:hypothetical protein